MPEGVSDDYREEFAKQKLLKIRLEADKLQHEKEFREGEYYKVSEVEETWSQGIKNIHNAIIDHWENVKSKLDVSAEELKKMDDELVDVFNRL